jgi:DNA-binding transcriptional MocR family regulator
MDVASRAPIDLTTALPPAPPELDEALRRALRDLAECRDLGVRVRRNRVAGNERDRAAAAAWLAPRLGDALDHERIVLTNGTQSALMLLLQALVGRDQIIAAESLTYVVLKQIAARLSIRIAGVALDADGMIPESFEAVCRAHRPRALYCNPTVHNPTTAITSVARRLALADIARRYSVVIIEDDVLGAVHREAPPPIAVLAPDITWYVMSLSKCFAMGLRMAYLVAPSAAAAKGLVGNVNRLSSWFPNSLSAEIILLWLASGDGLKIAAAVRREAEGRLVLAERVLSHAKLAKAPGALHVWMQVPDGWTRAGFVEAARGRGVLVRPADLFSVDDAPAPNHIRISLTGPSTRSELGEGLSILNSLKVAP